MKKRIPLLMLAMAVLGLSFAEAAEENGRKIFLRFCARCHGEDGSGSKYGKALKKPVRDLRTNRLFFSDSELLVMINHGASWREMPNQRYAFRATDEEETKDVAGYVRTLKYAPDAKNGERLFKDRCALCHAPEGAARKLWKAPDLEKSRMDRFWMARTIRYGIHTSLMYPRESLHTNTEIADAVEYVQGLRK